MGTAGGQFAVNRQMRASGGIVIRLKNIQFHLDPGPGALVRAQEYGVSLRSNNILLASHSNLDHCNDLNAVISAMTHDGLDKNGILIGSKSVMTGGDGERPFITRKHRKYLDKFLSLESGNNVKFGKDIELQTLKTKNKDPHSIGFKIKSDKISIGYTGDTSFFPELIDELKGSDILILNNLEPFGYRSEDHLSSDDSVRIISAVRPRLAIITHFGQKILEENPIYQARDIQRRTNVQTVAARDGLVIDPMTLAASLRKRKINT
ncbi:MBL fold metallo-hydrolase [Candidatus Woesearchaeota archaeon]|nr:MBL fold metallo-hydrolase [Candidatus Woesearchaeota archaeon]MBT7474923.1 MBL fold metallo-hydrolase [Candidatus Woesearchaeota archaeon]